MMHHDIPAVRIVIAGHVDHGKSTLIGRLLHDAGCLPPEKVAELQASAKKRHIEDIEWSFLLDSFQDERNQNVTIDSSQVFFAYQGKRFQIIDAPGHAAFIKNAITGASCADAAVLMIDAVEGMGQQTWRHAHFLQVMGLRQLIVAVNKMDLVSYDPERFFQIKTAIESYMRKLGLKIDHVVPLSAAKGENILEITNSMPWYTGLTLMQALQGLEAASFPEALPLRLPVQDVYKQGAERLIVGRLESGQIAVGDKVRISPTGEESTVSKFFSWPENEGLNSAKAGKCVAFSIKDKIYVERGYMCSHAVNLPHLHHLSHARIFWLDDEPLREGDVLMLRNTTQDIPVSLRKIEHVVDVGDLSLNHDTKMVNYGDVASVSFRARDLMVIDYAELNPRTGRFVLHRNHKIIGGGVFVKPQGEDVRQSFIARSSHITKVSHLISATQRYQAQGHKGAVFWLTGLSGAGKSTLAMLAEKNLFDQFRKVYVLDGDNIRHGLCADLGFSAEDRAENIRRVGEVSKLMADAGVIVITSFISPFAADREQVRQSIGASFHEVYIKATLEACEGRDPKGLYRKARSGQIAEFTGIDSPYDIPENPDLAIDTQQHDIEYCVKQLCDYIRIHTQISLQKEKQNDL